MAARPPFDALYQATTPPWDIGRPQPALVEKVASGELRGSVLDVGCGTGELVLFLRERGLDAWGLDAAPTAIARATAKARARGLPEDVFRVADALQMEALGRTFDAVTDVGVFHVFSDAERPRYARSLGAVVRPGGSYFTLVFSDREAADWGGPRRIAEGDFAATFGEGWRVVSVEQARFVTHFEEHVRRGGGEAWLARIDRAVG
jgi:SAM-dependent methyltransferase